MATATQIEQTEHSMGGHAVGGHGTADNLALHLDPELRFLLACCRAEISNGQSQLDQVLLPALNWDRILKLAEYHRLLPSLHASVRKNSAVPHSIRSAIDARFKKHVTRLLRFSAELSRITREFEDRGIQVLAHKGPALSQLLYGDPAIRQFGDLDFLVRDRDVGPPIGHPHNVAVRRHKAAAKPEAREGRTHTRRGDLHSDDLFDTFAGNGHAPVFSRHRVGVDQPFGRPPAAQLH